MCICGGWSEENYFGVAVDTTETDAPYTTTDIRKQYPSLFQGLRNLVEEYDIHLKAGATPHCLFTPRPVPLPLRPKVKDDEWSQSASSRRLMSLPHDVLAW